MSLESRFFGVKALQTEHMDPVVVENRRFFALQLTGFGGPHVHLKATGFEGPLFLN